jgi:ABC-2 type transport system ATP-binding protein
MISVRSVSKSFGKIKALENISFNIEKGEIFGILGPNGAGKSTIVNILNTLVKPDAGTVIIDGINTKNDGRQIKLIMGVVPQEIALYEELSAYENLMFWGGLYDIPEEELRKNVNKTLEIVDLAGRKDDRIKTFSGGMKRRINIACSLLHNPKILVLDEPTVGVDPQNRNHIFEVIEKLNNEGMTIIYTTHYLEEAERFCDKISIIDVGRIIAQGTLKELDEISRIRNAGGVIEEINSRGTNLESIYLKLTGKELRD